MRMVVAMKIYGAKIGQNRRWTDAKNIAEIQNFSNIIKVDTVAASKTAIFKDLPANMVAWLTFMKNEFRVCYRQ